MRGHTGENDDGPGSAGAVFVCFGRFSVGGAAVRRPPP